MQRVRYETVTQSPQPSPAEVVTRQPQLPVLVPTDGKECDGLSNCDIRKSLRRVRVVTDAEIFGSAKSLDAVIKDIGQQAWDSFKGVLLLNNAYKHNDHLKMREAYELLFAGLFGKTGEHGAVAKQLATIGSHKRAEFDLPQFVSGLLDDARVVLWWSSKWKQFIPAIFCPDYKTAVFVKLVLGKRLDLGNRLSKSVRVCPRCGKHFVQMHPKQDYDTPKCREAHRVARWRSKQRSAVMERRAKGKSRRPKKSAK